MRINFDIYVFIIFTMIFSLKSEKFPMVPEFLDCSLLTAPSVFSQVYVYQYTYVQFVFVFSMLDICA
jgi:hypothetical protein